MLKMCITYVTSLYQGFREFFSVEKLLITLCIVCGKNVNKFLVVNYLLETQLVFNSFDVLCEAFVI